MSPTPHIANLDTKKAAERLLEDGTGVHMNTWIVGRAPIGHLVTKPTSSGSSPEGSATAEKTFFLKVRIMAGQVDLKDNEFGLTDFKWLTAEELRHELPEQYFHPLRSMLADR